MADSHGGGVPALVANIIQASEPALALALVLAVALWTWELHSRTDMPPEAC